MTDLQQDSDGTAQRAAHAVSLRLIQGLRQGSNALEGVSRFSAGREPVFTAARALMNDLTLSGGSAVRWIKGSYGSGKTHAFARLLEDAHRARWVVSYVQVSGKGMGCELHKFEEIYARIVHNLVAPERSDVTHSLTTPGVANGWQWLLDQWVGALKRQAGARDGGDVPSFKVSETIDTTISEFRLKHGIQGSFGQALRGYAKAAIDLDRERLDLLLDWFAGINVFRQAPEQKQLLKSMGINEAVSRRISKDTLRQMTAFLRYRGYNGFLILVDEVENVLQTSTAQRRAAYTLLRELIDNVDEQHGMAKTLLYLSGTPDLFESQKGITEHEALASRVLLPAAHSTPNPAAAVIDLAAFPITPDDFVAIGEKIIALYREAGQNPTGAASLTTEGLRAILPRNPLPSPRIWVRTVVNALDSTP